MNRHTTRLFFFISSLAWVGAGAHLFLYQLNPTWRSGTDAFFGSADEQIHQAPWMPAWVTIEGLSLTSAIILVLMTGIIAIAYIRKSIEPSAPASQSADVTISHVVLQQLWEREALKVKAVQKAGATVASGRRNKAIWNLTADLGDVTAEERSAVEASLQQAVVRVQNAIGVQTPAIIYIR